MKKLFLLALFVVLAMSLAMATIPQAPQGTADVLGAHNGYGRGCVMCHAPHSGAGGNGVTTTDPYSGNEALWGQDLTPLYGQTLLFGDNGGYPVTLPGNIAPLVNPTQPVTNAHDPTNVILFCLSCHDGNLAKVGMMKGQTVESLPIVGGNAPTLLGKDGTTAGNYNNDHPVGITATFGCNPAATPTVGYNWDCTITNGKVSMTGNASSVFANTNYGFAVSLSTIGSGSSATAIVTCTSCHDQHAENIYSGKMGGVQGYYTTSFFLRGYYNPIAGGNSAAQFCRQCHGGESNEMHGQMSVPTV
jgi:cytochrome c553